MDDVFLKNFKLSLRSPRSKSRFAANVMLKQTCAFVMPGYIMWNFMAMPPPICQMRRYACKQILQVRFQTFTGDRYYFCEQLSLSICLGVTCKFIANIRYTKVYFGSLPCGYAALLELIWLFWYRSINLRKYT